MKTGAPVAEDRRIARATLAIVMMTKNEEKRLPACLDRVKGWADEIVIIDDESTDRTREVAESYGAKVFVMPSGNDHFLQWHRGSERSCSDWILHIDADEWVTEPLKRAIDGILKDDGGHSAFEIMRLNHFLGRPMRHGGWHHRHLILYKRAKARCEGTGIHVRLKIDGPVGFLDADIEHYPFSSIEQFIGRQNLYAAVEAGVMREKMGRLPRRTVAFQMAVRPLKLFWKFYVKMEGRKDGLPGLLFSWLFAFAHFVLWAMYWEIVNEETRSKA